jgi:hypothetical protein
MNPARLEQECSAYVRYLIGRPPDAYVVRKYLEYHEQWGAKVRPAEAFDRWITDTSARGPLWARLADVYAGRFHRSAAVRKKLVLTLALLECAPASFESLDAVGRGGLAAALLRLAWRAGVFAASLPLAMLLFLPVQAWIAVFVRGRDLPAMES